MISAYLEQLTQGLSWPCSPLFTVNAASNATASTIGPVLASEFERFIAVVEVSTVTGAGNVSVYLQGSNFANGANAVNISPTNVVGFSNTANTLITVEARGDQLPSTGNAYILAKVLIGGNSVFTGGMLIGAGARYSPASNYNNLNTLPVANQIVY